jgi:DNA-directed RNA polymerase specialized sigma24 family protein
MSCRRGSCASIGRCRTAARVPPRAYRSTVVTRLAIDHLRSARVRRETYAGEWLPEPDHHRRHR